MGSILRNIVGSGILKLLSQQSGPNNAPATGEIAADESSAAKRRRKGHAATALTGKLGAGTPSTAVKALLGE